MKLLFSTLIVVILAAACQQRSSISALDLQAVPTPSPQPVSNTSENSEEQEPDLLAEFNTPDQNARGKKFIWTGLWSWNSRYAPAGLIIKPLSPAKFKFEINLMNGANMGGLSGIARIKGNKAYFDDRDSKEKDADGFGCQLLFINRGSKIEIKQTFKECNRYNGHAVYIPPDFPRGKSEGREKNFVEREVFPDLETDAKFKALVGAREYEQFLDAFQLISEETPSDDPQAKVFTACVRGVCPWVSAAIMFDGKGKFWAARIKLFDKPGTGEIRYYTNDPAWTAKLPAAIEKWRQNSMPEIPVIYKNKPKASKK